MKATEARRALAESSLALLLACGSGALFLPPLLADTLGSLGRAAVAALIGSVALVLHWLHLVRAARALGRAPAGWLSMAVLLFPVGGAAALLLLSWHRPVVRPAPVWH